jgi:hypothetical protein
MAAHRKLDRRCDDLYAGAHKISKAGWSLGWVSAVDPQGRTIWIVDAHRDDGKRFIVRAYEKLTAFIGT